VLRVAKEYVAKYSVDDRKSVEALIEKAYVLLRRFYSEAGGLTDGATEADGTKLSNAISAIRKKFNDVYKGVDWKESVTTPAYNAAKDGKSRNRHTPNKPRPAKASALTRRVAAPVAAAFLADDGDEDEVAEAVVAEAPAAEPVVEAEAVAAAEPDAAPAAAEPEPVVARAFTEADCVVNPPRVPRLKESLLLKQAEAIRAGAARCEADVRRLDAIRVRVNEGRGLRAMGRAMYELEVHWTGMQRRHWAEVQRQLGKAGSDAGAGAAGPGAASSGAGEEEEEDVPPPPPR
jgi:hypothetical protein